MSCCHDILEAYISGPMIESLELCVRPPQPGSRISPGHLLSSICGRVKYAALTTAALLLIGMVGGMALLPLHEAAAQDKPVVPPSVDREDINIRRGRDIVQIPSLWYQEGDEAPDSVGVLRVARPPTDPDAVTYPDARYRFPVHLQLVTFVKNGQVAELPISEAVIHGEIPGRIIIRPPAEDHYDITEPFGVKPIKQVPGEETVVDAQAWYEASLRSPATGEYAPANRFHNTRELRGRLRSTAPGGEAVQFVIPASRVPQPEPVVLAPVTPVPPVRDRFIIPEARVTFFVQEIRTPPLDWTLTTALLAGPNRADLPGRANYEANRIKGDVISTLRWHINPNESYELSFFGSSQATFGRGDRGNHNDVPYGLSVAARFGATRAFELRAEAAYEDDPFQAQTFASGDERLRIYFGIDHQTSSKPTARTHWRLSAGPTYFRDRPSSWEDARSDARELGFSVMGLFEHRLHLGTLPVLLGTSAHMDQSWGYIRDAGHSNTTLDGRLSLKPSFRLGNTHLAVGPVGYVQYANNHYADIAGFSEFNLQFGLEATTRVFF